MASLFDIAYSDGIGFVQGRVGVAETSPYSGIDFS
jgi:hypothetical protein